MGLFYNNNMSKRKKEKFLKKHYGNKIITNFNEVEKFFRKYWKWIAETTLQRKECVWDIHFIKENNINYNINNKKGEILYFCDFVNFLRDNVLCHIKNFNSNYFKIKSNSWYSCNGYCSTQKYCLVRDWMKEDDKYRVELSYLGEWKESIEKGDWEKAAKYAEIISKLEFRNIFEALSKEEAECLRREGIGEIYAKEEIEGS